MSELEKHIKFTEKQLSVYRYHEHPDVLKMEALHKYLINLDKQNKTDTNILKKDVLAQKDKNDAESHKSCGTLFDTSEYIKKG